MFIVIYSFQVRPGMEEAFRSAWQELTRLFYEHSQSLGSRLHKPAGSRYIAYAQWPDRTSWETAGSSLPDRAEPVRKSLSAACVGIEVLHELEVDIDMTREKPFSIR